LISKKFEKKIVFESSVLAWIRIRIEKKCWIRIRIRIRIRKKSIRIHNPEIDNNILMLRNALWDISCQYASISVGM
jgi:hypothetical protein